MWQIIKNYPITKSNWELEIKVNSICNRLDSLNGVEYTHTDRSISVGGKTYRGDELNELNSMITDCDLRLWRR